MAKYCVVAPLSILEPLDTLRIQPANQLLLAHDIVKHREYYSRIFNTHYRHEHGLEDNWFEHIILDNSVIELGTAVNLDMILDAIATVRPSCVVLPDVLEDSKATIRSCTEAVELWDDALKKKFSYGDQKMRELPFLYVPQGKTLQEFATCAEALARHPRIHYWGVPRNLVKNIETRQEAIQLVKVLNPRRYVHMMGFSDDLLDDALCANFLEVDTIDSAVPVRCTDLFSLTVEMSPRGDWWENAVFNRRVIENIDQARKLFGR